MSAKFQIVVPNNDSVTNLTTFMRLIPAGMVIKTRNTGIKRHNNTAQAPYFLNQSFARFKSLLFNLTHLPYLSTYRYRLFSEIRRQR